MEKQAIADSYQRNAGLIGQSLRAGCVAAPASWAACALAPGALASPTWNPLVGIVTSFVVYFLVFYWFSKTHNFRECLSALGKKELIENTIRYGVHYAVMSAGYPGSIASPCGQLVAGAIGHLSVPFLLRKPQ